jgi:hypothetical protein
MLLNVLEKKKSTRVVKEEINIFKEEVSLVNSAKTDENS